MSLDKYWPVDEEVSRFMNPLAETVSDAIILAVHQPAPMHIRTSGSQKVPSHEQDLLEYFTEKDIPTGILLASITGASGVGKSHLVRWLHACVCRSQNHKHYLNIYIPKTASLRKVVELIIDQLPENQEYAEVKREFVHAVSDITIDDAVIRFGAALEIELGRLQRVLMERLKANPGDVDLKRKLDHAMRLPKLLSDAATVDYFRNHVFRRIIQRPVSGLDLSENDAFLGEFQPEDLDLPDSIEISNAAKQVRDYYVLILKSHMGKGKDLALEVLNSVVDQATSELFKLNESLGGMTLQDVILEIRRLLLLEKKELAIYVEDFAALTGIQETLLKVLIQEGVQKEERKYATIRSVIAVTDGYMAGRDTIKRRAQEWVLESHLNDEQEIFQRVKSLVASYLNAARLGADKLDGLYAQSDPKSWSSGLNWTPIFDIEGKSEECSSILKTFGEQNKIPLFPYNDHAIEVLVRRYLKSGDSLIFNPRFIINYILYHFLFHGKSRFSNNEFPTSGFHDFVATSDVAVWVDSLPLNDNEKKRYKNVVVIWGGEPSNTDEIAKIPKLIFKAFGLMSPDDYGIISTSVAATSVTATSVAATSVAEVTTTSDTEITKQPTDTEDEDKKLKFQDYSNQLENWIQLNNSMPSATAYKIKTSLAREINDRMDCMAKRTQTIEIKPTLFFIHNAKGQGAISEEDSIKICEDGDDPSGIWRSDLKALLRYYEIYSGNKDYDEFGDDFARISNLTDRMMSQVELHLDREINNNLQYYVNALISTSKILGLYQHEMNPETIRQVLLGNRDKESSGNTSLLNDPLFQKWAEFQDLCFQIRPNLVKLMSKYCQCYQGTGDTCRGLDFVRLCQNFVPSSGQFDGEVPKELTSKIKDVLTLLKDQRIAPHARRLLEQLTEIRKSLTMELGEDFDKNFVVECMRNLADKVKEIGIWQEHEIGFSPAKFENVCEHFRSAPIKESMIQLDRIVTNSSKVDIIKDIPKLGGVSLDVWSTTREFLRLSKTILQKLEKNVSTIEVKYEGIDPKIHASGISNLFDKIEADLKTVREETQQLC